MTDTSETILRPADRPLALVVMTEAEPDRETVVQVVERAGFRVEEHDEAGTALEAVEYGTPALVVHALDLPDMDGATFHAAVKKRAGGREVPTLAVVPAGVASDGAGDGLVETISRPLEPEALRSRLSELVPDLVSREAVEVGEPARFSIADGPQRKELEMIPQKPSAEPAREAESGQEEGPSRALRIDFRARWIGLGEWGIRGAEIVAERGIAARAVDAEAAIERARLEPDRRHRFDMPSRAGSEDWVAAARAIAADESLTAGLAEDAADADLMVVAANVGVGAGALLASMLERLADVAPGIGRLAIVRLPGFRSGPEERALALVVLNAVLKAPATGVLLVQPEPRVIDESDPHVAFRRLLDLWRVTAGAPGEGAPSIRGMAMARFLATPGFIGWREMDLAREDATSEGGPWYEELVEEAVSWQPSGFDWSGAQAVMPMMQAPGAWLDEGGRQQFGRFVQSAWDEAAPCILLQGLYVGEQPARATLLSSGMPYPSGALALRDSVQVDRERLAEKRKAARTLIPLGESFLAEGKSDLVDVGMAAAPAEPEAPPAVEAVPEREAEPEPEVEERAEPALEARIPEAEREGPAPEPEPGAVAVPEAGAMPPVYEATLALVRRVMTTQDLRAEVDLGEIRYALYDLLEILREEPEMILPEVFRATTDEWFERHHVNVAILAILAGDRLRGSLSEVIDLGIAALLHDVGMTSTRERWDNPARLPPQIFESAVESHPEEGFKRLQDIPGMTASIARIVLEEHERVDGTGYPEGLTGEAIDPGARILSACDVIEALTHPRPHRDHLSLDEAITRLRVLGDHSLDHQAVEALLEELTDRLNRSK